MSGRRFGFVTRRGVTLAALGALAVSLAAACGGGEATLVAPPGSVTDAGALDAAPDGVADGSPHDAAPEADAAADVQAPPRRTVELRSPLGSALAYNLLYDGDFELTTGGIQQAPWLSFELSVGEPADVALETGGLCRSGLRCAKLADGSALFGYGVSPATAPLDVSVWAKVPSGDCSTVAVSVSSCVAVSTINSTEIPRVADAPDASGWCHYLATLPNEHDSACVYVENAGAGEGVLIDDGSILPAEGMSPMLLRPRVATSAAKVARIDAVVRWITRHRIYGHGRALPAPSVR